MFGPIGIPGTDHHLRRGADRLRPAQAARAGPVARQEPRRVQARLQRAAQHARRRDSRTRSGAPPLTTPPRRRRIPDTIQSPADAGDHRARPSGDPRRATRASFGAPMSTPPDLDHAYTPTMLSGGTNRATDDRSRMSFLEHLDELRRRMLYSLYALVACCAVDVLLLGAALRLSTSQYFAALRRQADLQPADGRLHVQPEDVGAGSALLVASPFIFTQVWLFVAPGLYAKEKKVVIPFVFFSTLLFVARRLLRPRVGVSGDVEVLRQLSRCDGLDVPCRTHRPRPSRST